MRCFVTGATGFIGSNLTHELCARGHYVKALIRPGADLRGLSGASYETVEGDLFDRRLLADAMRGCEGCFHTAAVYQLWLSDYSPMYAANVDGARNVLESAARAGCSRIVHTSTAGCMLPCRKNGSNPLTCETSRASEAEMDNHYKRSKWRAEQVALGLARAGAPIIVVNPTAPVGPRDVKPTPTGRIVLDFLNRRMPAYVDTGLNWTHVRDVAIGHILAAEKGIPGERYILGGAGGNLSLAEMFRRLGAATGLPAPTVRMPLALAFGVACVSETVSYVTRSAPRVPLSGVRMARQNMFFDPSKAIRELGLPQTSADEALRDAARWFQQNGYVRHHA